MKTTILNHQPESSFENRQNEDAVEYDPKKFVYICPKCKSENVHVKSGMYIDLYTCNDCGYQTRRLEFVKYDK